VNETFDVKNIHMPLPPPPLVGVKGHQFEGTNSREVCLHPTSEATFWEVHRRYHKKSMEYFLPGGRERPMCQVITPQG
jgi:hypothetical protein